MCFRFHNSIDAYSFFQYTVLFNFDQTLQYQQLIEYIGDCAINCKFPCMNVDLFEASSEIDIKKYFHCLITSLSYYEELTYIFTSWSATSIISHHSALRLVRMILCVSVCEFFEVCCSSGREIAAS